MQGTSKKVVIITEGQLGDLLIMSPMIRQLRRIMADVSIDLLILQRNDTSSELLLQKDDAVYAHCDLVRESFHINHSALRKAGFVQKIANEMRIRKLLRQQRYDIAICGFTNDRFLLWAYFSGAAMRISGTASAQFLATHVVASSKEQVNVLNYYLALLQPLGSYPNADTKTFYAMHPTEQHWGEQFLRQQNIVGRVVVIHPGASGNYKIWPAESYIAAIHRLQVDGYSVVVTGSSFDSAIIGAITAQCSVVVTPQNLTLSQMASLFLTATVVVTNDSGPWHLAVAVGAKSVCLFRQHHDRVWDVYPDHSNITKLQAVGDCTQCQPQRCNDKIPEGATFGSYCMRKISVEQLCVAVNQLCEPTEVAN